MSVETLIKNSCATIGEGPHWDEVNQCLLYVDINEGKVRRWNSKTGVDEVRKFDGTIGFVVPCRKSGYLIGLNQTVSHFNWDSDEVQVLHKVDSGDKDQKTRFNDGKCDPSGRLWCGTMGFGTVPYRGSPQHGDPVQRGGGRNYQGTMGLETVPTVVPPNMGTLYSVEVDGTIKERKTGVSISNGLAWSADNKTMYYIDSIPRKVFGYDFDIATGDMSNERVVVDYGGSDTIKEKGYPDGMAIDNEGKLWVACYIAGKVIRFDPETGKELSSVSIPALRTTSCCFGGPNMDELFVTCSRFGIPDEEMAAYPLAGSVFRVTGLGVSGKPAPVYEG